MRGERDPGWRLEACSRYAALALKQEEALTREDFDLFEEIGAERAELREALGEEGVGSEERAAQERILAPVLEIERRMQRTLRTLREEAALQLRQLDQRAGSQREYARGLGMRSRGGDLDVRF